ncbi:preprotein translocase subunit SecE [Dyadobacter jejuensis]|uniref:Protein translocase subunit SecE n=1 Tax=Dyadobacter jejuensis TaxID=1082580 RepID=A0A316ARF5_9BACT|nr:preprotein translocase subunit SecE [Dyadobacter jejuensis]PWJ60172.1 preprotein translocase subunit SecE [Dyadobacter jejuensis]
MEKFTSFLKASWEEITQHVTWPGFSELQSNTTLVLVGSLIFALVVGVMDLVFENALKLFYQSF